MSVREWRGGLWPFAESKRLVGAFESDFEAKFRGNLTISGERGQLGEPNGTEFFQPVFQHP